MADILTFYHFNDVYHISDTDLIAKFAHGITQSKKNSGSQDIPPLTIFSGDVFSPSTESSVLKGEHMVPVLNHLDIGLACYGNHDFDFGEDRLIELSKKTNFPWLLSNVVHAASHANPNSHVKEEKLLALAQEYVIKMIGQYKIGFIGLAGTGEVDGPDFFAPVIVSPIKNPRRNMDSEPGSSGTAEVVELISYCQAKGAAYEHDHTEHCNQHW